MEMITKTIQTTGILNAQQRSLLEILARRLE